MWLRLEKLQRSGVRETGVLSWHHGPPTAPTTLWYLGIIGLLQPPQHYGIDGIKGPFIILPYFIETLKSLLKNWCSFFSLVCVKNVVVKRLPHILLPYTERNFFHILLNQTEIRLYLLFSVWFGTANGECPCCCSKSIGQWWIQSYFGLI